MADTMKRIEQRKVLTPLDSKTRIGMIDGVTWWQHFLQPRERIKSEKHRTDTGRQSEFKSLKGLTNS